MRIGVPRETKEGERRVGLLPADIETLAAAGHECRVEAGAGLGAGADDRAYRAAGARIVAAPEAWHSELVVKVKEIQARDLPHVDAGSTLFGFQHLVGEPEAARALAARGPSAIAYELVCAPDGEHPLLAPMSALAGAMAIDRATEILGHRPSRVLVLGAGHAGFNAARRAQAFGAQVTVLTRSPRSRDAVRAKLPPGVECALVDPAAIEEAALVADLIVGAVFVPGAPTPKLVPRSLVARMRRGAAIVDISIDAGGVAETSRPTTHAHPTFVEEGVVHYCVPNMPAADPAQSARALSRAALPFVEAMSGRGIEPALRADPALRAGLVLWRGRMAHADIAREAGLPYTLPFAAEAP